MSSVKVILGPVCFQDFEVPASINLGGKQMLAIHQLANGERVIDSMGPTDTDIRFSGTFSGPTAASRTRLLNVMRNTGSSLRLTWDAFVYTVIIKQFEADYHSPLWIPYRISCTVMQDETAESTSTPSSLLYIVAADVGLAAVQCSSVDVDISDISAALQSPEATTFGTSAYVAVNAAITNAQSQVQRYIANAQDIIRSQEFGGTYPGEITVGLFLSLSAAAQQLAELVVANGYLGRAAKGLAGATT